MLQTIKNAWKIEELRNKIMFTLFIVVLYRIGSVIPVPFIAPELMNSMADATQGSLFAYFNILSGEAFTRATLFALSISPYITSSIVIQLLTIAIPALERISKEGEAGRKKLTQITRYATVILALITSIGYYTYIRANNWLQPGAYSAFHAVVIIASYCAGAAIIMWLAEKINEKGIGNGISIILFANISASLPGMIYTAFENAKLNPTLGILIPVITVILLVTMIIFIVYVTNAERRLPVQYAKRQVGRKMYGGQNTFLPMKLNMSGVMPIIFASSIAAIPTTTALIIPPKSADSLWGKIVGLFSSTSPIYMVIYFLLIIGFAYFYLAISFNPIEVANNLKNNGGFIPGIRPGKPTTEYISKILGRITLIGAIFLGIVATLPLIIGWIDASLAGLAFGGSSLLILVSVAIETVKEMEAQMTMRHYKGFLE